MTCMKDEKGTYRKIENVKLGLPYNCTQCYGTHEYITQAEFKGIIV